MLHKPLLLAGGLILSSILFGYAIWSEPVSDDPAVFIPSNGLIVLELFTSQGCSSCPPAESVLSKIAEDKRFSGSVIPLAYHVDYWDYLGWKDPFSSGDWTNWQADYRIAFGGSTLYTPQIVIQGQYETVGSNEGQIKKHIQELLRQSMEVEHDMFIVKAEVNPHEIAILVDVTQEASVDVPLELVTVVYENVAATQVQAGENAGRMLRNNYVVRKMERMQVASGSEEDREQIKVSLLLEDEWRMEDLGVVSWLQDSQSMQIYTAKKVKLPELSRDR